MRFNVLSILGASMLATAGLSADSVNLAGAFDLNGELAKCAPGDQACVDLAQAKNVCWTQKSDVQSDLDNCLADAQRAYDMAMSGAPADVVVCDMNKPCCYKWSTSTKDCHSQAVGDREG